MIVDCISDLHGYHPRLKGGDMLIVAGDLTARDVLDEYFYFCEWMQSLKYDKKIVIAGNHDGCLQSGKFDFSDYSDSFDYLMDSGTIHDGFHIWGSPWTCTFGRWSFMLPKEKLKQKWNLIPDNTDILITHSPSYGILDKNVKGESCGCPDLREKVEEIKPRLHVFGHIHEESGYCMLKYPSAIKTETICLNAAVMNEKYMPLNKPTRVIF